MIRGFRLFGPVVAITLAAGCGDGSTTDSAYVDAGMIDAASDSSSPDVGNDTSKDVATDVPHEVGTDATQDVGTEEAPAPGCTTDVECDDSNPCSADTCVGGQCAHAAITGNHLACENHTCVAAKNTIKACADQGGCSAAGDICNAPAAGDCPRSKCPFDALDRFLDGRFPHFGLPYNDEWEYFAGETITNPDHPKYTSQSCSNDSKGGAIRSSGHVRAMHKGTIDVTFTGLSTAQANLIKDTLDSPKGWVRAGLKFNFGTTFSSATDIQFKYCASCTVSVSGPQGSVTNPCGSAELAHHDSDYNVINFSDESCFNDLSSCSRWLINHEVGHALGLADRENPATEGKTIMNHTHYYSIVWPSDDLIAMVVALRTCHGKACMTP